MFKRPNNKQVAAMFRPYMARDERLKRIAFGVDQPDFFLILGLLLAGILPGLIAILLLTRNYYIGMTSRRIILLRMDISGRTVKKATAYTAKDLRTSRIKAITGPMFTRIDVRHKTKPFVAKFTRAYSRHNRGNAMMIAEVMAATSYSKAKQRVQRRTAANPAARNQPARNQPARAQVARTRVARTRPVVA